jgi:rfaE bifunctional protein nucleotidyltransferase chain/domain
MNSADFYAKIKDLDSLKEEAKRLKDEGKTIVFTNGCFDILHLGHADYLSFAANQGDILIVGVNSDSSVKKSKGENRPIVSQDERAALLAALGCVDYVIIFDDDEPAGIISEIIPNVLVKGEDWAHYVSGREIVEANGGKVVLAPLVEGKSTTDIIKNIQQADA